MSMPSAWIEELFARLSVRYGSAFMRQYVDIPVDAVKEDWARTLDGFSRDDIHYALEHLPENPPAVIQIRNLCRAAPRVEPKMISRDVKADPGRVRELMARLNMKKPGGSPKAILRDRLQALVDAGGSTYVQRQALDELKRVDHNEGINGEFTPIPPEQWPWNQEAAA